MQIQVCRNCGNRNTVVSGELSACNYCGSTDLEPVSAIDGSAVAESSSGSGSLKWIILIAVVVLLGAGGFFAMQMMGSDDSASSKTPHPVMQNITANKSVETAPVQTNNTNSTTQAVASDAQAVTQPSSASLNSEAATTANLQQQQVTDKSDQIGQAAVVTAAATQALNKESEAAKTEADKPVEKTSAKAKEEVVTLAANDVKQEIVEKSATKVAEKVSKETITVKPTVKKETAKAKTVKKDETTKSKTTKSTKTTKTKKETSVAKSETKSSKAKESATAVAEVKKVVDPQQLRAERRSMRVLNNNSGVVSDRKTGLMWMACSIGQNWNGKSCSGEVEEYLWSEALDLAKETSYASYSDWRLPTRQELNSIVDCSNGRLGTKLDDKGQLKVKNGVKQDGKCVGKFQRPTIDKNVFPNTLPAFYWSYSHSSQNNYSAWGVFFSAGNQYSYNTSNFGNIRLVRNNR